MTRDTQELLLWFGANKRDLPWRRTRDMYRIWVSEVMLQQTQVATATPYYRRFVRRFPSVRTLARASEHDVLKMWEGMGYYARARNLRRAARIVVSEHHGLIPRTPEEFGALPGVGPYIRAAVLSIACGLPLPVVDGNVLRVMARYWGARDDIGDPATAARFRKRLHDLIPPDAPGAFNEALMELGAVVCTPRNPACPSCPLRAGCVALRTGRTGTLPRRRPARPIPTIDASIAVLARQRRVLIQRRPSNGLLGGLWEFPGGKSLPGESPQQTLIRECREELGIAGVIQADLGAVEHTYSHFRVRLHVFGCREGEGRLACRHPHKWVSLRGLAAYPLPAANRKFLARVRLWLETRD